MAKTSDKARAKAQSPEAVPEPAAVPDSPAASDAMAAPAASKPALPEPAAITTEVAMAEPGDPERPAPETGASLPPQPVDPVNQPETRIIERRTSPAALAIAALLGGGVAVLGSQILPRLLPGQVPQPSSSIVALESRLSALESAQNAAGRVASEAKAAVEAATRRIESLPTTASAQSTGAALPPEWAERLARLEAAEASASRQRGETGDAARREAQALTQRLAATEQALKAQQGPSPAVQSALRLSLFDRIRTAMATGQVFAAELAALQKDGVSAEALRPLEPLAQGAPTRSALVEAVRRQRKVLAEDTAATVKGWGDRVLQMADSLVQVRRVDGPADQPTPAGLTLALEQALLAGDTAKAAGLWNRLPEPARRATAGLGADLAARAAAEAALAAISAAELAAIARR